MYVFFFFLPQILQIRLACVVAQCDEVAVWPSVLQRGWWQQTIPLPLAIHTAPCALRVGVVSEGRSLATSAQLFLFSFFFCLIKIHFARGVRRFFFTPPQLPAARAEWVCSAGCAEFLVLSRICYTLVGYVRLSVGMRVCP